MPDYVYALHDFQPENEDEVDFRAGEPIEVIEKDDQYSDGWWQGRNLAGKIGLFPKSYTTPAAPAPPLATPPESTAGPSVNEPPDILQPLDEEAASFIGSDAESNIGVALGEPPSSRQEEVMQATMTDVQKAIEQLGQDDRDGTRSFSFASTRHGDTDRETDTETDGDTSLREDGEDWHRSARDKLARQARKVVEAKAATEAQVRSLAPPIDIEMSDESEAEEVDDSFQNIRQFARDHPHIPEEDEEDNGNDGAVTLSHRRRNSSMISPVTLPLQDVPSVSSNDGEQTAKVHKTSFSVTSTSRAISPAPTGHERNASQSRSAPVSPMVNIFTPVPVIAVEPSSIQLPASPEPSTHATPTPVIREIRQVSNAVSSPTPRVVSPPPTSKHNSVASSGQVSSTSMPQTPSDPTRDSSPMKSVPPSEWSVEEVVDWLKSKGFGQDVCDKFIEQEITGDVLLELDINLLKAEIGIVAFGKRMRIANAIAELRRPPSIIFPDVQSPQHPQSLSHSHSYSYTHSRSGSTHQSLNSPMFATTMSSAITAPNSATFGSMGSPESPAADMSQFVKRVSSLSSTGASIVGGSLENNVSSVAMGLGLGVPPNGNEHKRSGSGQLGPSPSDSALNRRSQEDAREPEELQDDDCGALSEGENVPSAAKQRRRLFGRSVESTSTAKEKGDTSSINNSTTALSTSVPVAAATPISSRKRELLDDSSIGSKHSRNKRDGTTRGTERHSLFGGTFTTSLGKARKPPPRISPSLIDNESPMEKSSSLNLSRLYSNKKSSGRPSTSDGSLSSTLRNPSRSDSLDEKRKLREKEKPFEKQRGKDADSQTLKEKESPTTLKKHADGPGNQSRGPSTFMPGKNIIDQIGTPDHQGWMRKKGDHYNAWKVRYFIIKGPHLYILRSDDKTEVKIKGYINIIGYKVIADENVDPGRYGFRIVHDTDKTHFFSSDEQIVVREWMKAIMKATIGRDYSKPVVSSVNIPTIPLTVAQAMNPAPRPPSPTARDATQKALRRENPNQLSSRDARVLMGLPSPDASDAQDSEQTHFDPFFTQQSVSNQPEDEAKSSSVANQVPPRPTREARPSPITVLDPSDAGLVEWANSHLPAALQNHDPTGQLFGGLALLRLSELVLGKSPSPPVLDSAFPSGPGDDKLDGLFRLFDFLLDNDVKMGSVSINDVRQGKRDKILQLLKALKAWEDRRMDILRSIGAGTIQAGPFMAPVINTWKR